MAEQHIVDYIKQTRAQGKTDSAIRTDLSTQPGVTEAAIEEAFVALATSEAVAHTSPEAVTPAPVSTLEGAPVKSMRKRVLLFAVIALVIFAFGGLAYAQYTGKYSISWLPVSSSKVWTKFQGQTVSKPIHANFNFNYTDKGSDVTESPFGGVLKNIKVAVGGKVYANGANSLDALQSESTLTYSLSSGNTSFSTGFEYRIVGQALYVNIGENPFLSGLMSTSSGVQDSHKYDWIKVSLNPKDLAQLQEVGGGTADVSKLSDQRYWQDLVTEWKKESFLETPTYIGKDKVHGVETLHYKTNIKKEKVRTALNNLIDKLLGSEDKETQNTTRAFLNGLIDKLEIQDMQIWVGRSDAEVYKIVFQSNAPSVASFAKAMEAESEKEMERYRQACGDYSKPCKPLTSATITDRINSLLSALEFSANFNFDLEFFDYGKAQTVSAPKDYFDTAKEIEGAKGASRNAKRLADVRQLASALELYFNDHNSYPPKLSDLTPTYIGQLPIAPLPVDGVCTPAKNTYTYLQTGTDKYKLLFCLGAKTGGYEAGVRTLSESGIQ